MKILIKFPSRERSGKLLKCVSQYIALASDISNIKFLFTFDIDDKQYNDVEFLNLLRDVCYGVEYQIIFGISESKIHAVNRDINVASNWDILLLASDDMEPVMESYDEQIINDMKLAFPDTDGVLWYNDGFRDDIITLSIMGRKYYDRFHYIYHPSYKSFYCDNEFTNVCKLLERYVKSSVVIIKHQHPDNLKLGYDSLYVKNSKFSEEDRKTFESRLSVNFEIP